MCIRDRFHGQTDKCWESGMIQKVKSIANDKLQGLNIPDEAVTCLILVRTYITLWHLNKSVYSREEENQRKCPKRSSPLVQQLNTFRYAYLLIIYIMFT